MPYPNKKELRRIRKHARRDLTNKEQAKVRRVVEQAIYLLRAMTSGQGDASIQVFDCGAGGGWESGAWTCDWLRDGMIGKSGLQYTPEDLRDSLMGLLAADHWAIAKDVLRSLEHGDWSGK